MKRSTGGLVLFSLLVGILIGLALAKWLVGAVLATGVAIIVVAIVVVAYFAIQRRVRSRREQRDA